MRVLLTSAIYGDEVPKSITPQLSEHDVEISQIVVPHHATPRLACKQHKMHTHLRRPDFDAYIWVDGSITVCGAGLVGELVAALGDADAAFYRHPERNCAYDEVDYCVALAESGHEYIGSRYDVDGLKVQAHLYASDHFPHAFGLWCGGLFIYRWSASGLMVTWHKQLEQSLQDQVSLPYAMWCAGARIADIPGSIWRGPNHIWQPHVNRAGETEAFK